MMSLHTVVFPDAVPPVEETEYYSARRYTREVQEIISSRTEACQQLKLSHPPGKARTLMCAPATPMKNGWDLHTT